MPTDARIEAHPVRRRLPVSWWTVGLFAVMLTAADGFWATSLRRAIGYIGSTQQPFRDWLLYVAVMLPIFAGTVLGALWIAAAVLPRPCGEVRAASAVVIIVAADHDRRRRPDHAHLGVRLRRPGRPGGADPPPARRPAAAPIRLDPGRTPPVDLSTCTGTCAGKHDTLLIHERAIKVAVGVRAADERAAGALRAGAARRSVVGAQRRRQTGGGCVTERAATVRVPGCPRRSSERRGGQDASRGPLELGSEDLDRLDIRW